MRSYSNRKLPSLPTSSYKDKPISRRSLSTLRFKLRHSLSSHPYLFLSTLFLLVFLGVGWSIGLLKVGTGERRRIPKFGEGIKVVARDYNPAVDGIKRGKGGRVVNEKGELLIPEDRKYNETILVRSLSFLLCS